MTVDKFREEFAILSESTDGVWPSGKAADFGSAIPRFES